MTDPAADRDDSGDERSVPDDGPDDSDDERRESDEKPGSAGDGRGDRRGAASGAVHGRAERAHHGLTELRGSPRNRRIASAAGGLLGLLAAALDPLGIALGAALVALPARDVRRGLATALAFGALVVALFVLDLAFAGSLGRAVETGAPFLIALGAALGGSLLGGLVRVVV